MRRRLSSLLSSTISFRPAAAADRAALTALLREVNLHYWGDTPGAAEKAAGTADALLGDGSGCDAVLAWDGERAVGFATITLLHPAPNAQGTLFMKDLFVTREMRGSGLGRAFLRHLAAHAARLGCARFDWTAETDNPKAIAFYDTIGATTVAEKVYFRFEGAEIQRFAGA